MGDEVAEEPFSTGEDESGDELSSVVDAICVGRASVGGEDVEAEPSL